MAVTIKKIDEVLAEVNRFVYAAKVARTTILKDSSARYGCKETGAVRRASMDLSRALVTIRDTKF